MLKYCWDQIKYNRGEYLMDTISEALDQAINQFNGLREAEELPPTELSTFCCVC